MGTSEANSRTRTTQLDELTAAALDEWQLKNGVKSTSMAIRQLLRRALALEGPDGADTARVEAWENTRVAVLEALDRARPGRAPTVRERVASRAKRDEDVG